MLRGRKVAVLTNIAPSMIQFVTKIWETMSHQALVIPS
jgi:hypothetical protein